MAIQKLVVGSVTHSSGGHVHVSLRDVEFEAEELGSYSEPENNPHGSPTRGRVETLYRPPDGLLVVHIKNWTHWQGETNSYRLIPIPDSALRTTGVFESLGYACGFGRPLTLDEALETEV